MSTKKIFCVRCATGIMEKGFAVNGPHDKSALQKAEDGSADKSWFYVKDTGMLYSIKASRCPSCGYVEFYAPDIRLEN